MEFRFIWLLVSTDEKVAMCSDIEIDRNREPSEDLHLCWIFSGFVFWPICEVLHHEFYPQQEKLFRSFPYDMKPVSPSESQPITVEISVFVDAYIGVIKPEFIRDSVCMRPPSSSSSSLLSMNLDLHFKYTHVPFTQCTFSRLVVWFYVLLHILQH